jgi:hypothetical protein
MIAASPELQSAVRDADPADWPAIVDRYRAAQRAAVPAHAVPLRCSSPQPEHERQHRYAAAILSRELRALGAMLPNSGRNDAVYRLVCRIGRWVHAGIFPADRLTADVLQACRANGLLSEDGARAVLATIHSGLRKSAADALPYLEGRHG